MVMGMMLMLMLIVMILVLFVVMLMILVMTILVVVMILTSGKVTGNNSPLRRGTGCYHGRGVGFLYRGRDDGGGDFGGVILLLGIVMLILLVLHGSGGGDTFSISYGSDTFGGVAMVVIQLVADTE
ncbi:hypothetical protein PoB_007488300 [Plakobranchus ocellatus]|uniref:Uncharacterized protein n=1 Tax=Plakobranchus ocellatus TaxID=259542 RepID=A0AAV4DVU8_9GAST|nr:hypothetical protein PoB_007488300 [Plakobranchus ocellatus]